MDIRDYLRILRRNWKLIAAVTMMGLLGGAAATILVKPVYTSETQLFVAIQGSGSVQELAQGNTFSQARVQSYVKTVTTPTVLQPVINSLGLTETPGQLAKKVKASSDPNTVIISVSVSDGSPVRAAGVAQAVAESLVQAVDVLEKPVSGGDSPVKLSVVTPASAPASASSPNAVINLVFGLIAGLLLSLCAAIVRTTVDTKIRGEDDLRDTTDAPILGAIAYDQKASKTPLLTQTHPQSPRAESFRQLRTNLQFAQVSRQRKSILVTSSVPGEGKSTTATNLALAIAESGRSVVLVDADLRRPMVSEYLGLEGNAGLTNVLLGEADVNDVLQLWGENECCVLTSGPIPPNPSELLGTEVMRQLIISLEEAFDAVIIDAPPLLPVTDGSVLAQHIGGVLLVVGAQRTKNSEIDKSFAALGMVDADVLGTVLNRVPTKGPDSQTYGYYSYGSTPPSDKSTDFGPRRGRQKTDRIRSVDARA